MIGYYVNSRGRLQCNYCNHSSYKTNGGILHHLENHHAIDVELDKAKAEIERLKSKPPKVEVREKIVYKEKPAPKFWYGPEGIYCSSCKTVIRRPGIAVGQTIENTPCACGNRTLMLITEFK